jgi:hypothetical protein
LSPTKGPEVSALILRRAGIAALVVSISAGMTSNLLFLAAFQFRLDRFLEPTLILGSGAIPAELLRWASVLDLFGYYLATAVLAYVLWRQLRPRNPLLADLSTLAAVGYALAGWAGAAVLAMVAPMLMQVLHRCHPRRSGADRGAVRDCVGGGMAFHLAIPRCHSLGGLVARNRAAPPPRSSPPIPPVAGARRGRGCRGRRQRPLPTGSGVSRRVRYPTPGGRSACETMRRVDA